MKTLGIQGWGHRDGQDRDTGVSGTGWVTTGCPQHVPTHLEALQELAQVPLQLRTVGDKHALLVQHVVRQKIHKGDLGGHNTGGQSPPGYPPKTPSTPQPTLSPTNHCREPRYCDSFCSFAGSCSR